MNLLSNIVAIGAGAIEPGGSGYDQTVDEVELVPVFLWRFFDALDSESPSDAISLVYILSLGGTDENTPSDSGTLLEIFPARTVEDGALGCDSGLPAFSTLSVASAARNILITIKPAKVVTGWSVFADACYQAEFEEIWGHRRDVLSVRTTTEYLSRAESVAACQATEGTYFYDPEYSSTLPAFVWDLTPLDSGYYWDQTPFLYVHLTDGEDPNSTVIVAQIGFFYASEQVVHPTLGEDLLDGAGNMETVTT